MPEQLYALRDLLPINPISPYLFPVDQQFSPAARAVCGDDDLLKKRSESTTTKFLVGNAWVGAAAGVDTRFYSKAYRLQKILNEKQNIETYFLSL